MLKSLKFLWVIFLLPTLTYAHLISLTTSAPFPATVAANSIINATYTVTNLTSATTLTVSDNSLFPFDHSGFSFLSPANGNCGNIAPGATCNLLVQFTAPSYSKTVNSKLRQKTNALDRVQTSLSINVNSNLQHYAYLARDKEVSLCNLNITTGNLTNCSDAINISVAVQVVLNSSHMLAYITDFIDGTVLMCHVNNATGALSSCVDSGAGAVFHDPISLVFNATNTLAYISNQNGSTITRCNVNSTTGAFSGCVDSGVGSIFHEPGYMAISNDGQYLYVPNLNSFVSICKIDNYGFLSNCVRVTHPYSTTDVTLTSNGTRAYLVNDNSISVCAVNTSTGALTNCQDSGAGNVFNSPFSLTLNAQNTQAYITNTGTGTISLCNVNTTSGFLNNCVFTTSPTPDLTNLVYSVTLM